ncbi:MAG: hypothetical protein J0I34_33360 [Pseudonocardia sp.]|uniref:hypothetical protein n=1 Tax=unclassified Pseudonocardia TaxID=2619320 RepID=UPI00086E4D01|nr:MULTISPECIES: hypothetical protein [unclassified Pseudonocardia]MBN9113650.1 hypothetical protein [Pseudonocardia sp.]ODU24846.1 MAG: hypothetical protein ABS80_11305 [Pseudonocardia sp. SCN 72-51]ODU99175.1 MAG: hypothetical protein ABT15_32310 [Pseudonocardia sp. SCN 73-27]
MSTDRTATGTPRLVLWLPGLVVALGAAAATAHGLYEVAAAARVPAGIAWIYPLITDGLAVVAYTATARLTGSARRYAWSVVVLSAGLSGLAQAVFLASDPTPTAGTSAVEAVAGLTVPAALRFGIGAWPAIAAALAAHLLHLLAAHPTHEADDGPAQAAEPARVHLVAETSVTPARSTAAVQPAAFNGAGVQADALTAPLPVVSANAQPTTAPVVPAAAEGPVNGPVERPAARAGEAPARERAQAAADRLLTRTGALPTVSELEAEARVSRGTAATVLKALREHPAPVPAATTAATTTDHEATQR